MKARPVALLAGVSLLLGAALARAHPLAPALLELREHGGGRVEVKFKTPAKRLPGTNLVPLLPEFCSTAAFPTVERQGTGVVERYAVACNASLAGARIGIRGLEASQTDALLRVELADGRHIQSVLRSSEPSLVIPRRPSRLAVLRDYVRLGVEHIASGLDHLLFVFGLLVLVAARTGPLLKTVTAFTVGHSVTLSLAVLGFVAFPSGLVELAIAGSIFVLGAELAQGPDAAPGRGCVASRGRWPGPSGCCMGSASRARWPRSASRAARSLSRCSRSMSASSWVSSPSSDSCWQRGSSWSACRSRCRTGPARCPPTASDAWQPTGASSEPLV